MDMCGVCDTTPANDCVVDCSGSWGGTRLMCEGVCLEYGKTCGGAGSIGGLQIKHIVVVRIPPPPHRRPEHTPAVHTLPLPGGHGSA